MTIRRWIAALAALALCCCCAAAETAPEPTEAPLYAPADMTPEEIRAFVELMFDAAAGTTVELERELRREMTEEEIQAQNAANAEYRARTLPWLRAVFMKEMPQEILTGRAEPLPSPAPTDLPDIEQEMLPVYTTVDSCAAFEETAAGREYLAALDGMGGGNREMGLLISQEICRMWMDQVDHERLRAINSDYVGWIYAPGSPIDYPIVHGEDNSHYLKRLFNGEKNSAGTLFIDYRNLSDLQDPNTLVYGHHMRNNSMFGTLTDYVDQAYFEGHPLMLMMNEKEIFLLELFAGYTTSDQDHCYDIAISDENDMTAFIEEAERKSDFTSGVHVKATDRLVTLSTCAYVFEDARYILIGRLVPVWNEEIQVSVWNESGMDSVPDGCSEVPGGQSE